MRRRGFSLLEAALVGIIITVAVLVLTSLFSNSMRAVRHSESRTYANSLAESALESLRAQGFGSLVVGESDLPDQAFDQVTYHTHVSVGVSNLVDGKLMKTVRATVSYQVGAFQQKIQREVWVCGVKS